MFMWSLGPYLIRELVITETGCPQQPWFRNSRRGSPVTVTKTQGIDWGAFSFVGVSRHAVNG